jgi:hypothetical protein
MQDSGSNLNNAVSGRSEEWGSDEGCAEGCEE